MQALRSKEISCPSGVSELIDQGLITVIQPGSLSYLILRALEEHPEGLSGQQLVQLTGQITATVQSALTRLFEKNGYFQAQGFELLKEGPSHRRRTYRLHRFAEKNSLAPFRIRQNMLERTERELNTFKEARRETHGKLRLSMEAPRHAAQLLANSTWAFHEEKMQHAAAQVIVEGARKGAYVSAQMVRKALKRPVEPGFFQELEKTSFTFAAELGLVIRCLTELPESGKVAAFFLDSGDRVSSCSSSYPNGLNGRQEVTFFDKVKSFNLKEAQRRVEAAIGGAEPLSEDVANAVLSAATTQKRGHFQTSLELAESLGISRVRVTNAIFSSIEERRNSGVYLRSRTRSGVECVLYEGSQS